MAEDVADGWRRAPADDFWSARPRLAQLHAFARSRRTAPWAMLGVSLARVVAATPPLVVLPALTAAPASLNLFVAVVGPSGAGKGAAERAAAEALDVGTLQTSGVGSGEGIAHLYARRVRGVIDRHADAVLMSVPEIDTLTALGARKGATLLPELRKAWSGEALGFSYADPDKHLPIPEHSYRLALVAGVQPARAEALLTDAEAGTPQRFLWLPATDPDAPDELPAEPGPLSWSQPDWSSAARDDRGRVVLHVCAVARREVDAARLVGLRGGDTGTDGHVKLAQLKTAAALALLEGRAGVNEEDWRLAGVVADVSQRTRDGIAATLGRSERERNDRRGMAEGRRAVVAAEIVNDTGEKRTARLLTRKLTAAGGSASRADLRRALPNRDRQYFEGAMQRLDDAGTVVIEDTAKGHLYRLADARHGDR